MAVFPAAAVAQSQARAEPRAERLFFFDNLRVVLTCAVIVHHVGQAYGPTGGEWPIQEAARAAVLGPFFTVNRSFGMSLFFLVSGYFMVRSYDRRSGWPFIRSRLARLGIPLLVFMAAALPVMMIFGGPAESRAAGVPEPNALHLWFVQHLLLYSLGYAGLRAFFERRPRLGRPLSALVDGLAPIPQWPAIVLFALGVAVASAVVRTWFPIDYWLNLLGFFRVAFADVPRDLALFVVGALAYRHGWLARFPSRAGRSWLALGLLLGALWYVYALGFAEGAALSEVAQGAIYAIWESLLCCGMCIGLVVLFRDRLNAHTPLSAEMGRSQYLAYIIHIIPVLALQAAAVALPAPPLVKFVLVSVGAVILTFVLSSGLRRVVRV